MLCRLGLFFGALFFRLGKLSCRLQLTLPLGFPFVGFKIAEFNRCIQEFTFQLIHFIFMDRHPFTGLRQPGAAIKKVR